MNRFLIRVAIGILVLVLGLVLLSAGSAVASVHGQQPTVNIPTVTGTAFGPYVIVDTSLDHINVRSGPGTEYPLVGVLVGGEKVSAKGRSVAGLWIQVVYPGVEGGLAWVYAPYVTLYEAAELPIVEPPPTPTPRTTPTIDPTLAAQFVLEIPATRLPTFTPPGQPLSIPTFAQEGTGRVGGVPVGMLITAVGLMGLFGAVVSYLRER